MATKIPTKKTPAPSAPPAEHDVDIIAAYPVVNTANAPVPAYPVVVPEPLPPSHTEKKTIWSHIWFTLKLVPFHVLNFVLGTGSFVIVLTGVCISILLLPLCGLGILVYMVLLQFVRLLAVLDIFVADFITSSEAQVRWNVQGGSLGSGGVSEGLRMAPKLQKFSWRSTTAVLYFLTVKFVLAMISIVSVSLPLLPIASEFVADYASDTVNSWVAGFNPHKFNFGTNPFWYFLTCVAYFVVGVILMHVFGRVSREVTRKVCCKSILEPESGITTGSATASVV